MNQARFRFVVLALSLAAIPLVGCETFVESEDCDPSAANNPVQVYDAGTTTGCSYTSAIQGAELLLYNGGMRYQLNHHLGCVPSVWQATLSFDETYFDGTGDGQLAAAAGNQAVITGLDATSIQVANDSCSDYYLLVTAQADPATCACGAK